jgi:predicted lipid-binding transport protein (Tim44 family)
VQFFIIPFFQDLSVTSEFQSIKTTHSFQDLASLHTHLNKVIMQERRGARGYEASRPSAERAPSSQNSDHINPFADGNPFADPERSSSDSSSIHSEGVSAPTSTVSTRARARVAGHPRDPIASLIFPLRTLNSFH